MGNKLVAIGVGNAIESLHCDEGGVQLNYWCHQHGPTAVTWQHPSAIAAAAGKQHPIATSRSLTAAKMHTEWAAQVPRHSASTSSTASARLIAAAGTNEASDKAAWT